MKKKILIINKSFELGGIQMALANMLEAIKDEYDITLAVFNKNGPLKSRVPNEVKILKLSPLVEVLGMNGDDCKRYGSFIQRVFKILGSVWAKFFGNALPVSIALASQKSVGNYDAVISYHQETSAKTLVTGFGRFALKKCTAPLRIAWVHADFLATKLATEKNLQTYKKFDKIVCVSKTTLNNFLTAYPVLENKCDYCYNYIPQQEIIDRSYEDENVIDKADGATVIFSAGRLVSEKGYVFALENLLPLWKKGINLKWYIAGNGPDEAELRKIITENSLQDKVFLLGFKSNPYPYIREADYLFLPSVHETFSMVVSEAHILGIRVIASDIPIMREMLWSNDFLCPERKYLECIESILNGNQDKNDCDLGAVGTDWKKQFERILEC